MSECFFIIILQCEFFIMAECDIFRQFAIRFISIFDIFMPECESIFALI